MSDNLHPLHAELTGSYGVFGLRVDILHDGYQRLRLLDVDGCTPSPQDSDRNGFHTWRIRCRHATITDFEHDASTIADLELDNPRLAWISNGGAVELAGTIASITYYPTGEGPDTTSDRDTKVGQCKTCNPPHGLGAYMPPARPELDKLRGQRAIVTFVVVRLRDEEEE